MHKKGENGTPSRHEQASFGTAVMATYGHAMLSMFSPHTGPGRHGSSKHPTAANDGRSTASASADGNATKCTVQGAGWGRGCRLRGFAGLGKRSTGNVKSKSFEKPKK